MEIDELMDVFKEGMRLYSKAFDDWRDYVSDQAGSNEITAEWAHIAATDHKAREMESFKAGIYTGIQLLVKKLAEIQEMEKENVSDQ